MERSKSSWVECMASCGTVMWEILIRKTEQTWYSFMEMLKTQTLNKDILAPVPQLRSWDLPKNVGTADSSGCPVTEYSNLSVNCQQSRSLPKEREKNKSLYQICLPLFPLFSLLFVLYTSCFALGRLSRSISGFPFYMSKWYNDIIICLWQVIWKSENYKQGNQLGNTACKTLQTKQNKDQVILVKILLIANLLDMRKCVRCITCLYSLHSYLMWDN